jgi:hypothetical protein
MALLCKGETYVAVAFFARHFPSKPPRRLESAATGSIRKFHLRDDEALVAAAIDVDLNQQTFPWDLVTHFS